MKRKLIITSALLVALFANAQEISDDQVPKNKKGNEILPKEGDIGLGFNTIPVLDALFNIFRSSGTNSGNMVQYTSFTNNQITGKYFLDRNTAIRARFGINTLSGSVINRVQDAVAMHTASQGTADDIAKASLIRVEDKMTFNKNNILFSVGYEKRRGYRRLQGVYGAEIGIGNEGASRKISYGNKFSDVHDIYYTNFSNTPNVVTVSPVAPGRTERELETKYRGGLRVGLRGFIGIEYFVFAKISVAAEYGWGYSLVTRRASEIKREVYNNGQNGSEVFEETVKTDSRELTHGFAVDNNSGSAFSITNTSSGNTSLNGGAGSLSLIFHF
jgi:hypothetical protein